jgi:hypothetical protein
VDRYLIALEFPKRALRQLAQYTELALLFRS